MEKSKKKYDDEKYGAKWWLHPYCITLYTRTSGTFYMFFPKKEELKGFFEGGEVKIKAFLNRKSVRSQEKKCLTAVERATEGDFVNYK